MSLMFASKEQHIIETLIEDELGSAKESVITSNATDPIVLDYIDTLWSIKRKFNKTFER